jgi:hypothetical protein
MKYHSFYLLQLLRISAKTVVACVHSGILKTHLNLTANRETSTKEVGIHIIIQKVKFK